MSDSRGSGYRLAAELTFYAAPISLVDSFFSTGAMTFLVEPLNVPYFNYCMKEPCANETFFLSSSSFSSSSLSLLISLNSAILSIRTREKSSKLRFVG